MGATKRLFTEAQEAAEILQLDDFRRGFNYYLGATFRASRSARASDEEKPEPVLDLTRADLSREDEAPADTENKE